MTLVFNHFNSDRVSVRSADEPIAGQKKDKLSLALEQLTNMETEKKTNRKNIVNQTYRIKDINKVEKITL